MVSRKKYENKIAKKFDKIDIEDGIVPNTFFRERMEEINKRFKADKLMEMDYENWYKSMCECARIIFKYDKELRNQSIEDEAADLINRISLAISSNSSNTELRQKYTDILIKFNQVVYECRKSYSRRLINFRLFKRIFIVLKIFA